MPSYNHPQNEHERESNFLNSQHHSRQISQNAGVDTFRLDPQSVANEQKALGSSRLPDYRSGSREELN